MSVTIVVAVGDNGVIGADGGMPWPPTGDQKQFKELTWGHPIVMGRATFESIGRPLPGRTSIVLTHDSGYPLPAGALKADSLDSALKAAHSLGEDIFLVGGAQVYREALAADVVDRMVVTHVHQSPDGDAWFEPIDPARWTETDRSSHDGYDIVTYQRA